MIICEGDHSMNHSISKIVSWVNVDIQHIIINEKFKELLGERKKEIDDTRQESMQVACIDEKYQEHVKLASSLKLVIYSESLLEYNSSQTHLVANLILCC